MPFAAEHVIVAVLVFDVAETGRIIAPAIGANEIAAAVFIEIATLTMLTAGVALLVDADEVIAAFVGRFASGSKLVANMIVIGAEARKAEQSLAAILVEFAFLAYLLAGGHTDAAFARSNTTIRGYFADFAWLPAKTNSAYA
ncbi:MAG: hypothetical protein ACRDHN_19765 [Thermomicrobiales bacterium]